MDTFGGSSLTGQWILAVQKCRLGEVSCKLLMRRQWTIGLHDRSVISYICLKWTCLCTFVSSTVESLHQHGATAHHWRAFWIQTMGCPLAVDVGLTYLLLISAHDEGVMYQSHTFAVCRPRPRRIAIWTKCMMQCFLFFLLQMQRLRWHCHSKLLQGHRTKLKSKHDYNSPSNARFSWQKSRWTAWASVSGGMQGATGYPWRMPAENSTREMQPPETHGHRLEHK